MIMHYICQLKITMGGQSWKEWPETLQKREKDSLEAIHQELTDEILFLEKGTVFIFLSMGQVKSICRRK